MKTINFIPPADGQPAPTIDMPFQDFLREKLEAHWDEPPEVRERALHLMPLIVEDCKSSEDWPPYMPYLNTGYTMFPDYPWKRSAMGAFAYEAISAAVSMAKRPETCPF